jgi:hypothetical protein
MGQGEIPGLLVFNRRFAYLARDVACVPGFLCGLEDDQIIGFDLFCRAAGGIMVFVGFPGAHVLVIGRQGQAGEGQGYREQKGQEFVFPEHGRPPFGIGDPDLAGLGKGRLDLRYFLQQFFFR